MKTLAILAIVAGILLVGGVFVAASIGNPSTKNLSEDSSKCSLESGCPSGGCTKTNNCGLSSCGATKGSSCGCGR